MWIPYGWLRQIQKEKFGLFCWIGKVKYQDMKTVEGTLSIRDAEVHRNRTFDYN